MRTQPRFEQMDRMVDCQHQAEEEAVHYREQLELAEKRQGLITQFVERIEELCMNPMPIELADEFDRRLGFVGCSVVRAVNDLDEPALAEYLASLNDCELFVDEVQILAREVSEARMQAAAQHLMNIYDVRFSDQLGWVLECQEWALKYYALAQEALDHWREDDGCAERLVGQTPLNLIHDDCPGFSLRLDLSIDPDHFELRMGTLLGGVVEGPEGEGTILFQMFVPDDPDDYPCSSCALYDSCPYDHKPRYGEDTEIA